jgi:hypothetical protein
MRLTTRLERLERSHRVSAGVDRCVLCGHGPRVPFDENHLGELRVVFDGDGDETPVHALPADVCRFFNWNLTARVTNEAQCANRQTRTDHRSAAP